MINNLRFLVYGCERQTPTDGIIYLGMENLISEIYPDCSFFFLKENNRFYRDTTILPDEDLYVGRKFDAIIVPGSPFLWDGYYNTPKIKNLLRLKEIHNIPVIWLGIGACFSQDNLNVVDAKFLIHTAQIFKDDLVFVRDELASRVLKKAGVPHKHLLCPSYFSTQKDNSVKSGKCAVFYEPSIGLSRCAWDKKRLDDYYEIFRNFIEKDTVVLCKDAEEIPFAEKHLGVTPTLIKDRYDTISKLQNFETVLSGRVHCAVPALVLGAKVGLIPIDSRHLTINNFWDCQVNQPEDLTKMKSMTYEIVELHKKIYTKRIKNFLADFEEVPRRVGEEASKWFSEAINSGFFDKYMSGDVGLDVGGVGYLKGTTTILPTALMIDLNTEGYDGKTLPFENESIDYIFSSHMLEHVPPEKHSGGRYEILCVIKKIKKPKWNIE